MLVVTGEAKLKILEKMLEGIIGFKWGVVMERKQTLLKKIISKKPK